MYIQLYTSVYSKKDNRPIPIGKKQEGYGHQKRRIWWKNQDRGYYIEATTYAY